MEQRSLVKQKTTHFKRIPLPPKLRIAILERDGRKCQICGRGIEDGIKLQVDHIFPVALGGTNDWDNLRTLCFECNIGKSKNILPLDKKIQPQNPQIEISSDTASVLLLKSMILKTLSLKINNFDYTKYSKLIDLGYKTYGIELLKKLKKLCYNLQQETPYDVFIHFYSSMIINLDPITNIKQEESNIFITKRHKRRKHTYQINCIFA